MSEHEDKENHEANSHNQDRYRLRYRNCTQILPNTTRSGFLDSRSAALEELRSFPLCFY